MEEAVRRNVKKTPDITARIFPMTCPNPSLTDELLILGFRGCMIKSNNDMINKIPLISKKRKHPVNPPIRKEKIQDIKSDFLL